MLKRKNRFDYKNSSPVFGHEIIINIYMVDITILISYIHPTSTRLKPIYMTFITVN